MATVRTVSTVDVVAGKKKIYGDTQRGGIWTR